MRSSNIRPLYGRTTGPTTTMGASAGYKSRWALVDEARRFLWEFCLRIGYPINLTASVQVVNEILSRSRIVHQGCFVPDEFIEAAK